MISVVAYRLEYNAEEKVSYVWVDEEIICPFCACAEMIKKGWRKRKLILLDDEVSILKVRRVLCKDCNKIHHVLPDIVVPYKRHDSKTIEKIIQGSQGETLCEESEINRIKAWWQKLLLYIAILEASIKTQMPAPPESKLSKAVRILANAHLWPRTRIALGLG
jgi:hypothetical protein